MVSAAGFGVRRIVTPPEPSHYAAVRSCKPHSTATGSRPAIGINRSPGVVVFFARSHAANAVLGVAARRVSLQAAGQRIGSLRICPGMPGFALTTRKSVTHQDHSEPCEIAELGQRVSKDVSVFIMEPISSHAVPERACRPDPRSVSAICLPLSRRFPPPPFEGTPCCSARRRSTRFRQ